ncbi:MAG: hypothetical protein LQ338_001410 [Usnochroma carphineum]|nr:MAG: hypothetical protein LQ338_001410 [Usnochroma carphineum]
MLIVSALTVVASLASLLLQATSAAPAYSTTGGLAKFKTEVLHRAAPSSLIVKSVQGAYSWHGFQGSRKIFAFGDSYTDSGFNPSGPQPNDTYPLGNPFSNSSAPPYHTFTNGPNWIEYLTFKYNRSLVHTYNLAVSGSTVNNTILNVTTTADLIHQISDRFVPNYVNKNTAGWNSWNSLFALFFGINDVNRSWSKRDGSINDAIFSSYRQMLDSLYHYGARNFLLHNVPPIDRGPYMTRPDALVEGPDINDFNYRMALLFNNFTSTHTDVTVFLFNTNSLFSQVLDNPSVFPQTAIYKNTTGSCKAYESGDVPSMDYYNSTCQYRVNQYFWLNGLHPTYPVHEALAAQVATALQ